MGGGCRPCSSGSTAVRAATGSIVPLPTVSRWPFCPASGSAVRSMRAMTWRADSCGKRCRTSVARPATYGAAKLVPWIGPLPRAVTVAAVSPPEPGTGLSDTTPVPGAATSTHGPPRVKAAG